MAACASNYGGTDQPCPANLPYCQNFTNEGLGGYCVPRIVTIVGGSSGEIPCGWEGTLLKCKSGVTPVQFRQDGGKLMDDDYSTIRVLSLLEPSGCPVELPVALGNDWSTSTYQKYACLGYSTNHVEFSEISNGDLLSPSNVANNFPGILGTAPAAFAGVCTMWRFDNPSSTSAHGTINIAASRQCLYPLDDPACGTWPYQDLGAWKIQQPALHLGLPNVDQVHVCSGTSGANVKFTTAIGAPPPSPPPSPPSPPPHDDEHLRENTMYVAARELKERRLDTLQLLSSSSGWEDDVAACTDGIIPTGTTNGSELCTTVNATHTKVVLEFPARAVALVHIHTRTDCCG